MRVKAMLVALSLVVLGFVVVPAQPALAISECNTGIWRDLGYNNLERFLPYWRVGNSSALNCYLRNGDYDNWGVVALQNMLIKCYGQSIARDGDFGPATEAALKNAQRIMGLDDDGIYGWDTYRGVMWPFYREGVGIDGPYFCEVLH